MILDRRNVENTTGFNGFDCQSCMLKTENSDLSLDDMTDNSQLTSDDIVQPINLCLVSARESSECTAENINVVCPLTS